MGTVPAFSLAQETRITEAGGTWQENPLSRLLNRSKSGVSAFAWRAAQSAKYAAFGPTVAPSIFFWGGGLVKIRINIRVRVGVRVCVMVRVSARNRVGDRMRGEG